MSEKQSLTAADIIAAVKGPVDLLSKALLLTEQASALKDLKIQALEQAIKEKDQTIKRQADACTETAIIHSARIKSLEDELDIKDKKLREYTSPRSDDCK